MKKKSKRSASRGKLAFMYGNTEEWSTNVFSIRPVVGQAWIFPAMLTHIVYPFKSKGERRSFSINFGQKRLAKPKEE